MTIRVQRLVPLAKVAQPDQGDGPGQAVLWAFGVDDILSNAL
jgi:hypothetical protein